MKKKVILQLLSTVLSLLKPETLESVADKILDVIEDKVADTPSKWDDMIVLPLCKKIREAFGIEDNDEE